jgi:glucose-fructose oxidoreductase
MSGPFENEVTRRSFIRKAGQGLLAANLVRARHGYAQTPNLRVPDPPGKKLGWCIVGLGNLSINQILPAFARCEKSRPTAFVSGSAGNLDKANKLAPRYGVDPKNIYDYKNFDKLKDNPDIDIVYIVLPNSMHAEYTIRALQAGKHVLCEKPMANTPKECEQMIAAARQAKRKLMIGYRLRYEPYTQALIKAARDKELIGPLKVVLADAGFNIGDPNQWRLKRAMAGGGSLMDIGIYALQAARYISGEEPVEVNAMEFTTPNDPRFTEVEETIAFQLRFPSGVLANCTSSYGAGLNRFRAVGPRGWVELEPALSYAGLRMRVGRGGSVEERAHPVLDHFAAEMEHMSECVMNNTEPLTPGEEGLRDLKIMMAIYEAARSGKTVKLA